MSSLILLLNKRSLLHNRRPPFLIGGNKIVVAIDVSQKKEEDRGKGADIITKQYPVLKTFCGGYSDSCCEIRRARGKYVFPDKQTKLTK